MFKFTGKGFVAVVGAAVAGSLVAVAGSFVVSARASAVAQPVQPLVQPVVSASASVVAQPVQRQLLRPVASFLGQTSLDDTGLLTLDVNQVGGAQALLVGREVRLLTGPATRIANVQGGLVARTLLDQAMVRVQGRLLPVNAWAWNDQGERVPTIRASRIVVLQLPAPDVTSTDTATSQDNTDIATSQDGQG
jgi:hypothetical protein